MEYTLETLKKIEQLLSVGKTKAEIRNITGVSDSTIRRVQEILLLRTALTNQIVQKDIDTAKKQ